MSHHFYGTAVPEVKAAEPKPMPERPPNAHEFVFIHIDILWNVVVLISVVAFIVRIINRFDPRKAPLSL